MQIFFMNVHIELIVIRTEKVKDKLFCFGDFQECESNNIEIFNYILSIFNDNGYDLSDSIFISSGDMYGESSYNLQGDYF